METSELIKRATVSKNTKVGVMLDKSGDIQVIAGTKSFNNSFCCNSYDKDFNLTNYITFSQDFRNCERVHLDLIETADGFFGKGIGSNAFVFSEFLIKDKPFSYINGIFTPRQIEEKNSLNLEQEDFLKMAKRFYQKNSFELITLEDFLKNPEKYPMFCEKNFKGSKNTVLILLLKKLSKDKEMKDFDFKNINGVFVKDNVPEQILEEIDCMQM